MLRKKISKLMALVMTITSAVSAVPAAEAKEGFVADGYEIIDAAYGNGTYVVMAKNFNNSNHPAKIYTSTDKKHWTETYSVDNAIKYGVPDSKQNLLYWEEQNVFVAGVDSSVIVSENGISWNKNDVLSSGFSYPQLDERDGVLTMVSTNSGKIKFAASLSEATEPVSIAGKDQQFGSIGAGPVVDGTPRYFAMNRYQYFRSTLPDCTGNWSGDRGSNTKDAKYAPSYNGWVLMYTSKNTLETLNYKADMAVANVLVDGAAITSKITAIGTSESLMTIGTDDGSVYYMAAPAKRPSGDTNWTKAEPTAGTDAITEKVTDFVSIDENTFFVTTATGVYTLNKNGDVWDYSDCLKYTDIESAKVSASSFNGITLLAGAYSPDLGIYAAIGNDQNSRSHIFYSEDGINWTMTAATTFGASTSAKNIAVWWPAQKCFVISNAVKEGTGVAWTSTDGKTWTHRPMKLGDNGDLQILGDYLYSANYSSTRTVNRYANLTDGPTKIFYSPTSVSYNMNTIALSDDETPYVLLGTTYGSTYIAPTSEADDITETPKVFYVGGTSPQSKINDAHWNKTINKFVAVNPVQKNIYLISKDKTVEAVLPNADAGTLVAVETNGSSYLTGDVNGNLFFTNGTDLSKAKTFSKVDCLGATANTMPVTNIFTGADGKYIVTVSDGTTSDVLIVNSDGSGYVKASEESRITSIKGGDEFTVSVKVANYGETAQTVRLIAAIYDKSGTKLLQVVSDDKTMTLNSTQYLELPVTANEDIPEDATLKVFIWNSLGAMVPLTNGDNFF